MNKILEQEICDMFEVYMYYMIVKYGEEKLHKDHLTTIFNHIHQLNMRVKQEKCTLEAMSTNSLDSTSLKKGINANLYKCDINVKMETLSSTELIRIPVCSSSLTSQFPCLPSTPFRSTNFWGTRYSSDGQQNENKSWHNESMIYPKPRSFQYPWPRDPIHIIGGISISS